MYTQEIACPKCGRLTAVNFLDKSGATITPCLFCQTKISVSTNDYGEVTAIEKVGDGCYIVTACLVSRGMNPDCEELATLRTFRDSYVAQLPEGDAILTGYYRDAPGIVAAIDASPHSREIYGDLYDQFIEPAFGCIRESQPAQAVALYLQVDQWLEDRMGRSPSETSARNSDRGNAQ